MAALCLLGVVVLAATASGASSTLKYSELPDPLARGPYTVKRVDPLKLGLQTLQEPNSKGLAATGANETITLQVRGVMFQPERKTGKSPLLVFVHGNHSECDEGKGPKCTIYKRNDEGYNYMASNLASWGYTVFSLDQDELMARQDSLGKGMHNRRLLIQAALEKLNEASEIEVPASENSNVGKLLTGKLDMTRIGLMGHSRGGDAVSSFIEYDHTLPVGKRFPLRGVVSIAPVDYERHAPYGVPYLSVFGSCDGDVSNLQGARLYERSQYDQGDPYPRFQVVQVGGNHDAYNTIWQADGDDASQADAACHPAATEKEVGEGKYGIRLSGEAGPLFTEPKGEKSYEINNTEKLNPEVNTRISADPARMGDQEKLGLATVAAFFRRYVGGEGAMEPYLTGELAAEGEPSIPQSACPSSIEGKRIPCIDRVADSYTAPPAERMDVLRPDTEHPTTVDALGSEIEAKGFANAYQPGGGVTPRPAKTENGISWCDPDPKQTEPAQLKEGEFPTAAKWCPQPAQHTLGGQGSNEVSGAESTAAPRENAPVNGSYGRQLSLAWEGPATMGLPIPAKDEDVSGYKALYMATAVNFFDTRNPSRGTEGLWNPEYAPQNFTIAVKDAEGNEATVEADNPDFGTAMQQTLGNTSDRVHVLLRDLRVPLVEFEEQGINLSALRSIELRFGGAGMPSSGSIQLADVRFEQPATGFSSVLLDSTTPNAGPAEGPPTSGPNPVEEISHYKRANGEYEMPNVTSVPGANVWTVDDDKAQCPNAQFEHIQEAVEYANPWDTIVVCPGVYAESSKPISSELNPVAEGAMNGLTINKPLKIIGAGSSLVKIKPASNPTTLAGATPYLRDGGGNVVTVSRQSLGSTEYDEEFVEISGVTIESPSVYAEAGVAFFNSSGRITNSVVGPLKTIKSSEAATKPYGWGVIETNSLIGAPGTAERQVTIANSKVFGYQAGGFLVDDARGADGAVTLNERSGMKQVGYVENSTIEGSGGTAGVAQTGVAFHSGATGKVVGSSITKNQSTAAAGKSFGILLSDAETAAEGVTVTGSLIATNDGYGLYNGNAAATEPSTTPVKAPGDFWGTSGTPIEGTSVLTPSDQEGISGTGSVEYTPVASAAPTIPAVPALLPDLAPVGEIVEPDSGEAAEAGVTVHPIVFAEDDYGVKSVSLKANGTPVQTIGMAPYTFAWTPSPMEIGTSVELEATITDSSGQVTTSDITVPVVKSGSETKAEEEAREKQEAEEQEAEEAAEEAAEAAKEKAAAEQEVKEAIAAAEATAKAAEESSAKASAESAAKAAEAVKAAEEKAAAATKEAAEAKKKAEAAEQAVSITFGKLIKNTTKGTARLGVVVPMPGPLVISGPDIKKVTGNPTGPGEIQVLIEAKGSALKTLNKKGKVTVTVTVNLSGPNGPKTATAKVTLVKK
jgi:hypothetical protein